jgi:small subunit ribosomal protein S6
VTEYEILLLLDPELPEERGEEILARTRELIERGGGTWERHQPWGRRKLAYEINHKGEGAYHLLEFSTEPETLDEISRVLRITDGVMRHLAVRRAKRPAGTAAPPPPPAEEAPEPAAAVAPTAEPNEGA